MDPIGKIVLKNNLGVSCLETTVELLDMLMFTETFYIGEKDHIGRMIKRQIDFSRKAVNCSLRWRHLMAILYSKCLWNSKAESILTLCFRIRWNILSWRINWASARDAKQWLRITDEN